MNKFNVGIIGCGALGRTHANCIQELEHMQTISYCDVHLPNAQNMLEQFGGKLATADAEELLRDSDLDVIYITTQHDTHAELCIRALQAGKHVLVEKPMAMTVQDCARIGATVKATGKKLFTAFKMRYYNMLWKAKELIPQPVMVVMQMMDNRWAEGIWPNDPVKGGGNVLSQGCHSTDVLRYMAGGNPVEVYAAGGNYYQQSGVIDNLTAVFRFDNGAAGTLIQGDCSCPPVTGKFFLQLFAEHKSITFTERLTKLTYAEDGKETVVYEGTESGFIEENRAFEKCLVEDTPPPIDHIDGLYATLMILQAIESLKSGKPEKMEEIVAG